MPQPSEPRNPFRDPLGYIREVSQINQQLSADMQARRQQEMQAEIQRRMWAEAARPAPPPPPPLRLPPAFPKTDESIEAERLADELMALRNKRY